jgi:hypothetical protein
MRATTTAVLAIVVLASFVGTVRPAALDEFKRVKVLAWGTPEPAPYPSPLPTQELRNHSGGTNLPRYQAHHGGIS